MIEKNRKETLEKETKDALKQKSEKENNTEEKEHWILRFVKATLIIQNTLKADERGYNFKYCPLPRILNEAKTILAKHYLTVIQYMQERDNKKYIVTELIDLKNLSERVKIKNTMVLPEYKYKTIETESRFTIQKTKAPNEDTIKKETQTVFDYQDYGKSITYYKRYSLFCILNIHPEKDTSEQTQQPQNLYQGG